MQPWIRHGSENSFKPTSHEWCMSATDKVVKLFGLREHILHDGLYLNSLARVITMFSYNKWFYKILDTRVSEVTDGRCPHYAACLDSVATCCSGWETYSPHSHRYLDNLVRVWLISKLYMDPLNFGALEQKETLTQERVLLSRSDDNIICVTAAAARDLSVWMTCPKLTSTHPQICLTGKHNKNINTLRISSY